MPLYTYQCNDCHAETEELQSMSEPALTVCDACGGKIERLIGQAHIGLCNTTLCKSALQTRKDFDDPTNSAVRVYEKKAKAAGVSTTGKFYLGSLATEFADPKAWFSDLDDIKSRCKEMGWECKIEDGDLKVNIPIDPSKPMNQQTFGQKQCT